MSDNPKERVNAVLPQDILPGPDLAKSEAVDYIQSFIKQTVPSADLRNLKTDLKWQFLLEHHSVIKAKRRKQKKTFLTRQQRKSMGLLKLPSEGWNYQSLEKMRNLWQDYMRGNLELVNRAPSCSDQEWNSFSVIVAKSEMVGAELKVVKSKVPSLIGMSGTVVLETKMSFQLVTPENKLKTILKDTSVFEFVIDKLKFTFFGKHLATRPSDRSVKKIKSIMHPDL
ncbi:uncharacterized protein LOC109543774 [Dendroctonus ponderosae]|uniref:Ribonuclease P protein subunit p29 n=1 Tax=Dendroctonus ponderosae TaxID=77166 RepID=U4UXG0_DENPD|nr:uncharacterized protein LOC109543774 [Dendroctonus ponderosae]ERL95031.1 hypothetical protein D910_12301 [Dendroctonus ponderosae]KAH1018295.1 hypothetical protein HUJ05_006096 [Dendroctonus ponderosae]